MRLQTREKVDFGNKAIGPWSRASSRRKKLYTAGHSHSFEHSAASAQSRAFSTWTSEQLCLNSIVSSCLLRLPNTFFYDTHITYRIPYLAPQQRTSETPQNTLGSLETAPRSLGALHRSSLLTHVSSTTLPWTDVVWAVGKVHLIYINMS